MKQERVRDRALIKVLNKGFCDSNVRQGGRPRRPLKVVQPVIYKTISAQTDISDNPQ